MARRSRTAAKKSAPSSAERQARHRRPEFHALSIADLLRARDAYHVHLTRMKNVVATAIGLYRIYRKDPNARDPRRQSPRGLRIPRTLQNSVVRPWSWPCILVFVEEWIPPEEFGRKFDQIVPPRLYLPDGLVVPTCVILVERTGLRPVIPSELRFPVSAIGGGYPVLADVQETTHIASLGCLVSDGDLVFALTNRHVTGDPGRTLYTLVQGQPETLGIAAKKQLGRRPFEQVYPGWKGGRTESNLDVGLIEIANATRWTSQTYGIGEFGPLYDLGVDTLSLDLIGRQVTAYGATSGRMNGEIQALFYRYRSVGGTDFVADLLIGEGTPTAGSLGRLGNSGTVWFIEDDEDERKNETTTPVLRPLALHWGAQVFSETAGDEVTEFALATFLSTVCRELDIDLVRDMNVGLPVTWGKLGHYKVGAAACQVPTNKKLKAFLAKNLDRIAFSDADLEDLADALRRTTFTALADVPDIVWKERSSRKRGRESPNHFADMDQPSPQLQNRTLMQLCNAAAKVDVALWTRFYDSLGIAPASRGLLPFRVWQLYEVMVDALGDKDVTRYLCAAGVLAHYAADACQPLHASQFHDGDPITKDGKGVHSDYQTKMVDRFADQLIARVNQRLPAAKIKPVRTGREAGFAIVQLMRRSLQSLPPKTLIETFLKATGKGRVEALWQAHGTATAERMVDGAAVLASIWQGAWKAGGGDGLSQAKLVAVNKTSLRNLYESDAFAPSVFLHMMRIDAERLVVTVP